MTKNESVNVQGTEVSVLTHRKDDYISLTDMAKHKNAEAPEQDVYLMIIKSKIRLRLDRGEHCKFGELLN